MLLALFDPSSYAYDWRALPHFAVAVVAAALCALILWRERATRVSLLFAMGAALFMLWLVGRGVVRLLTDPVLVAVAGRYLYVMIMLALPTLYQFIVVLLRRERHRWLFIRFNWILGAGLAIASISTTWVIGGAHAYSWGLEPVHGRLGGVIVLWISTLIVVASVDLWQVWRQQAPGTVERSRVGWFAIATFCLYGAAVDFLAASGVPVYPFAFVPVLGFLLLTTYVTWRFGLVEVTPQLAAKELAEMLRGGLLLLDRDGVIQVVNRRAGTVLQRDTASLVGQNARALLGGAGEPQLLARLARNEEHVEKEFLYTPKDATESRDLAMAVSAVRDRHGREVAYVCLLRDVTEQKRAQHLRLQEGLTDAVTGLPNRTLFLERLDATVQRGREAGGLSYAVCFVGVDRMRTINDDLGFGAGDRVLVELAERLRRMVTHGEVVARLGGDEFGVLIEQPPHAGYVRAFVERLEQALRAPLDIEEHRLYLSASIGVAGHEVAPTAGADLLRKASIAMYRVKERGGGGVHFINANEAVTQHARLEADLRRALEAAEFRVFYQPVMSLTTRRVAGFEALVRWQHPERGLVLPGEFIEFAEKVGLGSGIDCYVLGRACAGLALLQASAKDPNLAVNVNLGEEALQRADIVDRVREQLQRHRLAPGMLRLEVLERMALVTPAHDNIERLRALGVGLCIDDFGTGYSALSRLHTLPITVLKIDRDFVRAMTLGEGGEKIIRSIIALGESLNLGVIAEGAGMAHEVNRLAQLGCRYVQGFYFSPAITLEQALDLVRDPAPFIAQFTELEALAHETERPRVAV